MQIKHKWPLLSLLSTILITLFVIQSGLTINITPSMPKGFYIKQTGTINHGDIVLFCLDESYQKIGLQQHYLHKGSACHGSDPLIKQVIAIPGDTVQLTENYFMVNQQKYVYKTWHVDSTNRTLAIYPRGIYKDTQEYWLIGVNDVHSWDSRYWGPITAKQIRYKLKPILTW